jgi:MinD superfamily P-loop ATPase
MQEITVISGKGGCGKTSLTAAFAALSTGKAVFADCDVDAADLHLILEPEIEKTTDFYSGNLATIDEDKCVGCGKCAKLCRFEALSLNNDKKIEVNPLKCEGCGVCYDNCPVSAIDFPECKCGEWYISNTPYGSMVHARLGAGGENSGRLVSLVRKEAKRIALEKGLDLIVTDGPPGIGCPVIATLTDVSKALIVIEPTMSGEHDLERVLKLTRHFKVPAFVCVNKADINLEITERIEKTTKEAGAEFVGRVRFDHNLTVAQKKQKPVVMFSDEGAAEDIKNVWERLLNG